MNKLSRISTFIAISLALSQASFASNPALNTDREAVNSSCSAEAAASGCSDKKVGSGLLKCIHTYKKTNKDFKISEVCKNASQKLKTNRKALKSLKEAKKAEKQAAKDATN